MTEGLKWCDVITNVEFMEGTEQVPANQDVRHADDCDYSTHRVSLPVNGNTGNAFQRKPRGKK